VLKNGDERVEVVTLNVHDHASFVAARMHTLDPIMRQQQQ